MKKIEKVSIADISFALDYDAYVSLEQYLDSLRSYYDGDPDGGEIIADIEARIAELILNEQVYTKIVNRPLIDSIITQLGNPEEFDEEAEKTMVNPPLTDPSIPKRLYRVREGRILGGVCSGMSQYWDISVAWVRLIFLLPIILFIISSPFHWGGGHEFTLSCSWIFTVIYIVLWFALPMAKTPRQKLEARGEKITPSSIRQNLQKGATTPATKKAASVFAEILAVLGRVLLFFIKFIVAVIGFSFLISALAIFAGIIVALINSDTLGILAFMPATGMTILSPFWFVVLVLVCVMMPFFVLGTALLSTVFSWRPGRIFFIVLLGIWIAAMIFCSIVAASNTRYLRHVKKHIHVIEWFHDRDIDGDKRDMVLNFLDKENNGRNNISINIAKDSIEVISWRQNAPADDSTYVVSPDSLEYENRVVIKGSQVRRHNRVREGRVEIRRTE